MTTSYTALGVGQSVTTSVTPNERAATLLSSGLISHTYQRTSVREGRHDHGCGRWLGDGRVGAVLVRSGRTRAGRRTCCGTCSAGRAGRRQGRRQHTGTPAARHRSARTQPHYKPQERHCALSQPS